VQGRLFLNVVVGQGAAILKLFASKDETLLIRGNPLLVLDLGLDIVDGVGGFNVERDCFPCQCLHEDLHPTSQAQNQVQGGLLLDVIIRQSTTIFELFSSKDEALLVWGDAFLILDFGLDVVYGVGSLYIKRDGFSGQSLHKDLHTGS